MSDPVVSLPPDLVRSNSEVSALAVSWELEPDSQTSEFKRLTGGGLGLTLGVIDTGVDRNHPALEGCQIVAEKDFTRSRTGAADHNGHGTFVLHQLFRLLPNAKFVIGKVLGDNGNGTSTGILAGAEFCANNGCEAINASLGAGNRFEPMGGFLNAFKDTGLLFAASGNSGNGFMGWPALWGVGMGVIPIGAYDQRGNRANFSSWGEPLLALGAGVEIVAAKAQSKSNTKMSGSSMGCPDAMASVMGYLSGIRSMGAGEMTAAEARTKLVNSLSEDIEQAGRDKFTGFGAVTRELVNSQLKKLQNDITI